MKRLDVLGEKDDVVRGVGDSMPPTGLQKGMKLGLNNYRTSTEHQPHLKLHTWPYDKTDLHPLPP